MLPSDKSAIRFHGVASRKKAFRQVTVTWKLIAHATCPISGQDASGLDGRLPISLVFDGFASLSLIKSSFLLIVRSFLFIELSLLFIELSLIFIVR
jgi:hypothetical protein